MKNRIRILVAEDTTLVRRLLMSQLAREADFHVLGEAENGQDAVRMAFELRPDVVLMNLELPVLNGIQAMERILCRYPEIRVLLLTSHESLVSLGKMVGAADCLQKSCTPSDLMAAIRKAYEANEAKETAPNHNDRGNLRVVVERIGSQAQLTEREKAVVYKLVSMDDTVSRIACELGMEWQRKVTESAVKHTIERAMNKLHIEPRTRAALVKYVIGQAMAA